MKKTLEIVGRTKNRRIVQEPPYRFPSRRIRCAKRDAPFGSDCRSGNASMRRLSLVNANKSYSLVFRTTHRRAKRVRQLRRVQVLYRQRYGSRIY